MPITFANSKKAEKLLEHPFRLFRLDGSQTLPCTLCNQLREVAFVVVSKHKVYKIDKECFEKLQSVTH